MPQSFVHEVEIDGTVYELEGGETPPTEAEARAAVASYIPRAPKSFSGLIGNAINDVASTASSTVAAALSSIETAKSALRAKQEWDEQGMAGIERIKSGEAPRPSFQPGVLMRNAQDRASAVVDAAYERPVTAAMLVKPSIPIKMAKGAVRGAVNVAKHPGVLKEPALEAAAGWALGGAPGAAAAVILPKALRSAIKAYAKRRPGASSVDDMVGEASARAGASPRGVDTLSLAKDPRLLELEMKGPLKTYDEWLEYDFRSQRAAKIASNLGTYSAGYGERKHDMPRPPSR